MSQCRKCPRPTPFAYCSRCRPKVPPHFKVHHILSANPEVVTSCGEILTRTGPVSGMTINYRPRAITTHWNEVTCQLCRSYPQPPY